jgi:hypothetical protein
LPDDVPNKGVRHFHFPDVAMRLLVHVCLLAFFVVMVVQPENILAHADHIWEGFGDIVIHQARIDGVADQCRNLRSHSSLNIQLSYWK